MIQAAADYIQSKMKVKPRIGVVLGSGLGAFAEEVEVATEIQYSEIPGWPQSTAVGHAGKLVTGNVNGVPVAVMAGRAHLYEGYTQAQATFGVRVLQRLGVQSMIFTNAAGGINLNFGQGALVAISDHINLQGSNPLIGPNDDSIGPRFPDMSDAYSKAYRLIAFDCAAKLNVPLQHGVYAALTGPNYETPAEIRYLRAIGADLVGMSTVPEVLVANHAGMKVLAISCVTNMAAGILEQKINHEEVLETGLRVRGAFVELLKAVIPRL